MLARRSFSAGGKPAMAPKHTAAIPRRDAPGWSMPFLPETREQGMPDARCTRDLMCNVHKEVRT